MPSKKKTTQRRSGSSKRTAKTPVQKRTKVKSGTRGVQRKNKTSQYPEEFKQEVLSAYNEIRDAVVVGKMFDIPPRRVRVWVKQSGSSSSANRAAANRKNDAPATSTPSAKNETESSTTPQEFVEEKFVDHEERKRSLDHLFQVMDAKVRSEGPNMKESQLKSIALGMSIVSDKIDVLNKKEVPQPQAPTGTFRSDVALPDNVRAFLPKSKEKEDEDEQANDA